MSPSMFTYEVHLNFQGDNAILSLIPNDDDDDARLYISILYYNIILYIDKIKCGTEYFSVLFVLL